jgi:hypothetical protein
MDGGEMMSPLWMLIGALATYRLTRLMTADRITEPLRSWIETRSATAGYLVTCDWCLSIWIAPWPALLLVVAPDAPLVRWGLSLLAFSALTGLMSLAERRLDR